MRKTQGFTLIELLVVVAIIGILALTITSALGSAQKKARDARRQQDMKTIQTALEIYNIDNGQYPGTGSYVSSGSNWSDLEAILGVTLPVDPLNEDGDPTDTGNPFSYKYRTATTDLYCGGQAYLLIHNKEAPNSSQSSEGVVLCDDYGTYNVNNGVTFVTGSSPLQ